MADVERRGRVVALRVRFVSALDRRMTSHEIADPSRSGDLLVQQLVQRAPAVALDHDSLREAADLMVSQGVGRLPVVSKAAPKLVIGMLTRSDLLAAHCSSTQ